MDSQQQYPDYDPGEYAQDLKHELRVRGMPDMDLTCNIYQDGFLTVFISNCSSTGFTLQAEIPQGASHNPKRMAESICQTFLDFTEGPKLSDRPVNEEGWRY